MSSTFFIGLVRIFFRSFRIEKSRQRHGEMSVRPVKKNASMVTPFYDWTYAEKQNEKQTHESPGVKDHSKNKDDEKCNKDIREFKVVKDHNGRINRLTHSRAGFLFEGLIIVHKEWLSRLIEDGPAANFKNIFDPHRGRSNHNGSEHANDRHSKALLFETPAST